MKSARLLILLVLLVAALLRLADLGGMPPGLEHDEVANWLIDRGILAGQHGIYFTAAYGHEAGYHYLQAAAVALLGDHALSLRLPSVYAGLVGIAVSYALGRRLFGETVALVGAALLAVLWWPLFFSRLGLRAISLPAVSGLAAWFFWRGGIGRPGKPSLQNYALGGLLGGLSLYTYMAARAVPLIFALFGLYLALFHRPLLRRHWRGLALFAAVMTVTATPLALWLAANPGAEFRISEISQPLEALRRGDLGPVVENAGRLLGFFGWRGDPLIRQNVPGRPVLDPVGAVLFYPGLALALWRWRKPEAAFVLIWLAISLVPSLVTADAPSSIRCINALVVTGVPVGLALEQVLARLKAPGLGRWAVAVWLVLVAAGTVRAGIAWAQEDEVQFVWQAALHEAAAALDADPDAGPVAVGGWTPQSMDPPTMALYLRREDLALGFFDPSQALLVPGEGGRLVWPNALPPDPLLTDLLAEWGTAIQMRGRHTVAVLPRPAVGGDREPVRSEDGIAFLGVRARASEDGPALLTFWRAGDPTDRPLRIFLHVLDGAGEIVAQADGLGVSAAHWTSGDIVVQLHRLALPAGEYAVQLGLYNPETGSRQRFPGESGWEDTVYLERVVLP